LTPPTSPREILNERGPKPADSLHDVHLGPAKVIVAIPMKDALGLAADHRLTDRIANIR